MFCLLGILDQGQVTNISVKFPWLSTLFTTTTQVQGLNARLVKLCEKELNPFPYNDTF